MAPKEKKEDMERNDDGEGSGEEPESGSKGQIKHKDDGTFEYWDPKSKRWVPAAYHNDYRREFLGQDAPKDGFVWDAKKGIAQFDETSHMEAQRPWDGNHLERILDDDGNKVMLEFDRKRPRRPAKAGYWTHLGRILLDHNDQPLRDWPELNKTLSTEIEGWRLEAIRRLHPWIGVKDIVARMPHYRQTVNGGPLVPLQSTRAFTNRAMRFRQPKAILPVHHRKGTDTFGESFTRHRNKHSTAETMPELTRAELKRVKMRNKGKFNQNSRYVDESNSKNASSNLKREFKEEEASGDDTISLRTKRPRVTQVYAPMPIPHDRLSRIPTDSYTPEDPEMALFVPYKPSDEDEVPLVPLFVSLDCETLAAIQDSTYTTPQIVLQAKANGCTMLGEVDVRWYREDIEREMDEHGVIHPYVVMRESYECNVDTDEHGNRLKTHTSASLSSNDDGEGSTTISEASTPPISPPPATTIHPTATAPSPAPVPDISTPSQYDAAAQTYEYPWLHHQGPFGF